jgi:hypothetical protein
MGSLEPAFTRIYHPSTDDPTLSMIIDDGLRPPAHGFWLHPTPTGYLIRLWHGVTFGRIIHGYRMRLWGEPRGLVLAVWGFRSWDEIPDDGTGYWGHGDAPVDDRAIRCLEAAGLLVPHH